MPPPNKVSIVNIPEISISATLDAPVEVSNFPATQAVTGPVTDAQLRATAVPTADSHTAAVAPLAVRLTDGSSFYTASAGSGLTDTQLRASAVPVSATALPLPSGASTEATLALIKAKTDNLDVALSTRSKPADQQHVIVDSSASVAVTGPATDTQLRATPLPVSGTVTANVGTGTQPVSGTFWQATQPVSGTFWQATQPVSGPLTDTQLRAAAVPISDNSGSLTVDGSVSVSNFPATQPVSGTVTANAGTGTMAVSGPVTDTQLRASAVPVSGPVTDTQIRASALPVSGPATDAQLRATPLPVSGTVTANPPTLTKGAQGSTGVSTQDLKDAGRVMKVFQAVFTAAATEALVTLTPVADGVAGSTGTSFAVTSGKKLRLVSMSVSTRNAGAAGQGVVCLLRMNPSGAAILTSPIIGSVGAGTTLAVANAVDFGAVNLDMELSGTMQLAVSQVGTATAGNTFTLIGYEY